MTAGMSRIASTPSISWFVLEPAAVEEVVVLDARERGRGGGLRHPVHQLFVGSSVSVEASQRDHATPAGMCTAGSGSVSRRW